MSILHSYLKFSFGNIENHLASSAPDAIYKYFSDKKDRENFLKGNIYFSGPNKNRFHASDHGSVGDKFEYRNKICDFIFEYSLSFSTEILDESKPNIKIVNIKSFMQEIIDTIQTNEPLIHRVSWLSMASLLSQSSISPVIYTIEDQYPKEEGEIVLLHVISVGGRRLIYERKIVDQKHGVSSIEVVRNARNQNIEFEDEQEWRIHINTGDFLGKYSGHNLIGLVQYLKLFCPGINKYCEPID